MTSDSEPGKQRRPRLANSVIYWPASDGPGHLIDPRSLVEREWTYCGAEVLHVGGTSISTYRLGDRICPPCLLAWAQELVEW